MSEVASVLSVSWKGVARPSARTHASTHTNTKKHAIYIYITCIGILVLHVMGAAEIAQSI
jgi:hypothetical protein